MTGWDWVFLALALADLILVGLLAWIGLRLAGQGKSAVALARPAAARARGTVENLKALALAAGRTGESIISQVKQVGQRVGARLGTTQHLIRELRPPLNGQEARAMATSARQTAARGKEWADRLGRLRRAASGARSRTED